MTTPIVPSVTDELIAELEAACAEEPIVELGRTTIRRLLSERAELKRDAARYRLFAATVAAEFAGLPLTGSQKALFDAMNSREEVSGVDDVGAMFDAAMTQ